MSIGDIVDLISIFDPLVLLVISFVVNHSSSSESSDAKRNKYCKSSIKVILLVFVLTVKNNHRIQRETETIPDQFVNYGLNQLKIRIRGIIPKIGIV